MRSSKVFLVAAALTLATVLSALPTQVASAQPPSTQVLVPSTGATVSGTQVVLDASASAGVTQVQFELTGGTLNNSVIATATPTIYGWIALWNSTTVGDGTYTLQSVATSDGASGTSPGISITVSNGAPSVSIVLPNPGAGVSGTRVALDAIASPGVTLVGFLLLAAACPVSSPCSLGAATSTIYGWVLAWNSESVPNGTYQLLGVAQYANGRFGMRELEFTVDNSPPTVVLPSNGSSVSGNQWLDCVAPSGTSGVQFWLTGGTLTSPALLGAATPTIYGWLLDWNTATSVPDGGYDLYCSATYPQAGTGQGPSISVVVSNNA